MNKIAGWINIHGQPGLVEYYEDFLAPSWKDFPDEAWAYGIVNNGAMAPMIYFDPRCVPESARPMSQYVYDGHPIPKNWFLV
jgi:hypothetical protein